MLWKACRKNFDKIAKLVERDRYSSSHSIGQELSMSHQTVINHLKKLGVTKKLDVWVSHELTQKNIFDSNDACESLLNRNKIDPFWSVWWKVGHLRQRKAQTIVVEKRWSGLDGDQAWIDGQVITTCICTWRTRLVVWSWPQESPVRTGSPSFLPIGKRASIRGALWSWHLVGNASSNKTHIWLESHYCNLFYEQLKIQ